MEHILVKKMTRFLMMRAENFFILRRKPVEVTPLSLRASVWGWGVYYARVHVCTCARVLVRACVRAHMGGQVIAGCPCARTVHVIAVARAAAAARNHVARRWQPLVRTDKMYLVYF